MKKLELSMPLDELKRRYTESAEKPETMIDILADLNDTESTFIAYLLHHMGCAVPQVKLPRSPRSLDAPSKDVEYRATAVWAELKKNGIVEGPLLGTNQSKNKPEEKPTAAPLPKAVSIWIAYLRDQYSTAILSDEDLDVLRKLQTIF